MSRKIFVLVLLNLPIQVVQLEQWSKILQILSGKQGHSNDWKSAVLTC